MTVPLRIAVPSKGRLADPSVRLFREAGLPVETDGRRLRVPIEDHDLELLFARADDIPVLVADGACDLGIAGENQAEEAGVDLAVLLRLGYGRCRLAVAVAHDAPVHELADLAGLRVATSYPRTVRSRLAAHGVKAHLVAISGSVELTPSLGAAEAVADLVSTGETLRQNGLREIATLVHSEAVLFGLRSPGEAAAARIDELVVGLASVLAARPMRYLMLNAHDDHLPEILALLPGIDAPTILPLARDGMHAVHSVVGARDVVRLLAPLKAAGASGILVLPIEHLIP